MSTVSKSDLVKRHTFMYIFNRYVEGKTEMFYFWQPPVFVRPADIPEKLLTSSSANSSFVPVDGARK